MLRFGVIAEGPSDQQVIENILLGFFINEDEEPVVNPIQPPAATTDIPAPPGGWTRVFDCLKRGYTQQALQFNDCLVIHIDTDRQEDTGFDVSRREQGRELSVPERVDRVIDRLNSEIDPTFRQDNANRILFAIAVDSIECWLLPLLYQDKKKAAKTAGCLQAANAALRKADKKGLSKGDTKFPLAYDEASRDYTKRKKLLQLCDRNPSLGLFVKRLAGFKDGLTSNGEVDSGATDKDNSD